MLCHLPYTGAAGNKVDTLSAVAVPLSPILVQLATRLTPGPAVAVTLSSEVSLLGSFPFTTLTASQSVS